MSDTDTLTLTAPVPLPKAPPDPWPAEVRRLLFQTWGEQACQPPADWPEVLARLVKDAPASPGTTPPGGRGSLAPLVDAAVAELAALFGADDPPFAAAAAPAAVWRAFPRLDPLHCAQLAALLIAARAARPHPSDMAVSP